MDFSFKEITEITVKRFEESSLGKLTEIKDFDKPRGEYDKHKPICFGSSAERDRLESDLSSAKRKLESSSDALEKLLKDKADGWMDGSRLKYRIPKK